MKLIINDKDVTGTTGEVTEFRSEVLLPHSFLESLQDSGITVTKSSDEYRVNFKPEAILKLLSKDHPFPADLSITAEKDPTGKLKAKAELGIGDFGKASIDQSGKIEAGIKISF